jgi:hypothetical protein
LIDVILYSFLLLSGKSWPLFVSRSTFIEPSFLPLPTCLAEALTTGEFSAADREDHRFVPHESTRGAVSQGRSLPVVLEDESATSGR